MKSTFSDIMKLGVQALSECYHALDDEGAPKKKPPVSVDPGATHRKDLHIPNGGSVCEFNLKFDGGETVDFAIFHRAEHEAYQAGRRDVLVPVVSCKEISELRSSRAPLDAGNYILAVHNHNRTPIALQLSHKLRKPS